MSAKDRAVQLWAEYLPQREAMGNTPFRRTIMDRLMSECGVSNAAAATHYNHAKKAHEATHGFIDGLGRAPVPEGVVKAKNKPSKPQAFKPDNECFAVIELVEEDGQMKVGRCQTFLMQGDASETFDSKIVNWPNSEWVMIQGLGPAHGESFKLDTGEKEIKRYDPVAIAAAKAKEAAEAA